MSSGGTHIARLPIVVASLGLAGSVYAFSHQLHMRHGGATGAYCNINDFFNCDRVAASAYAYVGGLPQGVLGIAYFTALVVALARGIDRVPLRSVRHVRRGVAALASIYCIYLMLISLMVIHSACLTCLAVHACAHASTALAFRRQRVTSAKLSSSPVHSSMVRIAIAPLAVFAAVLISWPLVAKPLLDRAAQSARGSLAAARLVIPTAPHDIKNGPSEAPVEIVVFVDYMCPYCAVLKPELDEVLAYEGAVARVRYKQFPMASACNPAMTSSPHEFSCAYAILAMCAAENGRWTSFTDNVHAFYAKSSEAVREFGVTVVGLSRRTVDSCFADARLAAALREDGRLGAALGIQRTPGIFIDGRRYEGPLSAGAILQIALSRAPAR